MGGVCRQRLKFTVRSLGFCTGNCGSLFVPVEQERDEAGAGPALCNVGSVGVMSVCCGYHAAVAVIVQSLSRLRLFANPWTAARQASLSFTTPPPPVCSNTSTEPMTPSNHLILCCPLLLLPSIFPSIRVFSNESALRIRWPNDWSFSISPSNEYPGLISLRMDWLDLPAVQGSLESCCCYEGHS